MYKTSHTSGDTAAAVPPPFRPSEPALCGSCPLVTPYYCRLGDLLCFMYVYRYLCLLLSMHVCFVLFPLFDLSFVDFPSLLWYCWLGLLTCKNCLPYNLYCVGGDVKHCSIQSPHTSILSLKLSHEAIYRSPHSLQTQPWAVTQQPATGSASQLV